MGDSYMKKNLLIGYYNLPNFVTALSLLSTITACYLVVNGQVALGMIFLAFTMLIDSVDGTIAKKINKGKGQDVQDFGAELDSATDLTNYTVAPIVIGFSLGFNTLADVLVYWIFLVAATQRIAYFNLFGVTKKEGFTYHIGFVTPIGTYILTYFFLFYFMFGLNGNFVRAGYLIVAFLFVLNKEIKDLRGSIKYISLILFLASLFSWLYLLLYMKI